MAAPGRHRRISHRRPSRTGTKVAVAGTTLSTAAVPVFGIAAPAHAANAATWDRVAMCESSGNWHDNTGNGYYGGLQFLESTWLGYGGGKYGARADLATPAEQMAIANRVLEAQGPGAWPVCGPRAGLTWADTSIPGPPVTSVVAVAIHHHHARHAHHARPARPAHLIRYTVRSGDTLSGIASRYHVAGGWERLYQLNRRTIGSDPGMIYPGQRLLVPRR
jgi:hypothetical protein